MTAVGQSRRLSVALGMLASPLTPDVLLRCRERSKRARRRHKGTMRRPPGHDPEGDTRGSLAEAIPRGQTKGPKSEVTSKSMISYGRARYKLGARAYCVEDFARLLRRVGPNDALKPKKAKHQKMTAACSSTSLDAGSKEAHIRANAAMTTAAYTACVIGNATSALPV